MVGRLFGRLGTKEKSAFAIGIMVNVQTRRCLIRRAQRRISANKKKGIRIEAPLRLNVTFELCTACFSDKAFAGAFRMSRPNFRKLLDLLRPDITKKERMGQISSRTTIPADIRLGVALRMFAGAKPWDLAGWFRMNKSTVTRIFLDVISSLLKRAPLVGLPTTIRGLHKASLDFKCSRRYPSPLNGCVGALDGIVIKIKRPGEEDDPRAYYNRKGFYGIPVQALCDSNYRFLTYSARCVGSTHDALAHSVSKLGVYLTQGRLNGEFWVVGDEAYGCTETLITPIPKSECDEDEDALNWCLSQIRMHIEQAFGMMVAKWSILEAPLQYSVGVTTRVVGAIMCLHNWCINNQEPFKNGLDDANWRLVFADTVRWHRNIRSELIQEARARRLENVENQERRPQWKRVSKKRDMLLSVVKEKGIRRPMVRGRRIRES